MAYLTAHRYGLRKLRHIPDYLREYGWEPGWQHDQTGMRAMLLPGAGERWWIVMDRDWRPLSGYSSSLRAASRKIIRLAR